MEKASPQSPQEVTTGERDYDLRIRLTFDQMGWGPGWKYVGRTAYYIRPVSPLTTPRTKNGKPDGKRRYEPGVAFPNGMFYSGVLFKSKEHAEFISQMMYNQALLHYELEQTIHEADRTRVTLDQHLRGE